MPADGPPAVLSFFKRRSTIFPTLSPRERATLLAALLFWQEEMTPHDPEFARPYFETLGLAAFAPLTASEIEELSRRLRE